MAASQFIRVLSRRDVLLLSFGAMIGWSWVLLTGDWLTSAGTLGTLAPFALSGRTGHSCALGRWSWAT